MDGDPAVEPELDSFSLTLPLPYRVALIVVLGVWAWGANLHYLSLVKIDVPSLINYPQRASPRTDLPHHLSTYRLALLLTLPFSLSILLFWALSHRNPTLVIYYDFLPISLLLLLLVIFFLPRRFASTGRSRFLQTLRRVSIGGLAQAHDGKFGDILLADVLTSYAKVIADLFVALCMFFSHNGSATKRPDRACGGQYLVPIIIAIPSLIRLRQCLIEYVRVRASNRRNGGIGSQGWGGQHLANALKYSSAFPVIIFSALQRNMTLNHDAVGLTEKSLYRAWLLAVIVNSLYSFYWDVAKDWDLTLFSALRSPSKTPRNIPFGLRSRLYFHTKELYYIVIVLDLLLRCTWSLKLSPHLDHFADFESGIFLMEFLEVGRRWIWIFFRVETEWVRSTERGVLGGPGQDDVLLGEYSDDLGDFGYSSGKDDDD
ncbi:protein-ER retention protein-like protein [Cadophora sp. MPI-SDFR-AT-0126]|nr:protein-ER retention protein-like protein [Leotiomycetes sp. MPI-SDFR-AT-0126]